MSGRGACRLLLRPSLALGLVLALSCPALGDTIGPLHRDPVTGEIVLDAPSPARPKAAPALPAAPSAVAAPPMEELRADVEVTAIAVTEHDGQSFITWNDAAKGADGARYRYSLYRSNVPITEANLGSAQLIAWGILNNSGKLAGFDYQPQDRLDPSKPMSVTAQEGAALPMWSGLAVHTATATAAAYYAVAATDGNLHRLSRIVPGQSATIRPVEERPAPIAPIQLHSAVDFSDRPRPTPLAAESGRPLTVKFHASNSRGSHAELHGDSYLYFGNQQMGYRDGMPGLFSVWMGTTLPGPNLELYPVDLVVKPDGSGALETIWFGYYCRPQWATQPLPHAYPFTENRLLWMIDWTVRHYQTDKKRIYAIGYSMGGWGIASFALRHPELFAALYPMMPRFREVLLPNLMPPFLPRSPGAPATMPDGRDYFARMDMVAFVAAYHGELPFIAWSIGRHDGFASWREQVDMVRALTVAHRGFAFGWNNGNHGAGGDQMRVLLKTYPAEKFSLDQSYPAFSHSSLDNNLGNGDPENGDKEGGINLGFAWSDPIDTTDEWEVTISNALAATPMTVDVTPRRIQHFRLPPGGSARWQSSSGASGTVVADKDGLVTIPGVTIKPGRGTTLTISSPGGG